MIEARTYSEFQATDDVLCQVGMERAEQDARWGEQNHEPLCWLGIMGEEFGELSKELIEPKGRLLDAYNEAIQLAACAVAFCEYLRRHHAAELRGELPAFSELIEGLPKISTE